MAKEFLSLEVLEAKEGDCLILHFGTDSKPEIIVIDGGPSGVYNSTLKPRLDEIKARLSPAAALEISMVMVSHLDDDHINGILKLVDEAITDQTFVIPNIWVNTFDDIIGNIQLPRISSVAASATASPFNTLPAELQGADSHLNAVVASTGQGRKLRGYIQQIGASHNNPFQASGAVSANLVRDDRQNNKVVWDNGLLINVLHPDQTRLEELQRKWDEDLTLARLQGDDSIIYATIASPDTSPFNLSSIVCMVERGGKRVLLTGDGRQDDIYEGLKRNSYLDQNGDITVDILKMPHHGSDRNMSIEFLKHVKSPNYVISANGKHHNPDLATLEMIAEARIGDDNFTIHLTNKDGDNALGKVLKDFTAKHKANGRSFKIKYRNVNKKSFLINLMNRVNI